LIAQRQRTDPYQKRRVHVKAAISSSEVVITIRDEGTGFNPQAIPDPRQCDLEQISGRGLLLMRTFMDEVAFNATGNEITLTKRRRPANDTTPSNPTDSAAASDALSKDASLKVGSAAKDGHAQADAVQSAQASRRRRTADGPDGAAGQK
jgi:hypothetical protein